MSNSRLNFCAPSHLRVTGMWPISPRRSPPAKSKLRGNPVGHLLASPSHALYNFKLADGHIASDYGIYEFGDERQKITAIKYVGSGYEPWL